jgi:hypothetical protein
MRSFFHPSCFWGVGVLLFSVLINLSKTICLRVMGYANIVPLYLGLTGFQHPTLAHFNRFNLMNYLQSPYIYYPTWQDRAPFLNYFMRSSLYGEFHFSHIKFAGVISRLNLAFLSVAILSAIIYLIRLRGRPIHHVVGILIPIMGVIFFTTYKRAWCTQDFRYVYPILIPLVILNIKGLESLRLSNRLVLFWTFMLVELLLPVTSTIFYLMQYCVSR